MKRFGIGLLFIFVSVFSFLMSYLNSKIISASYIQSFAINDYSKIYDYYLDSITALNNTRQISVNWNSYNFIPIDSLNIFVNKGIFGFKFLTDSFAIKQKTYDTFKYSNDKKPIDNFMDATKKKFEKLLISNPYIDKIHFLANNSPISVSSLPPIRITVFEIEFNNSICLFKGSFLVLCWPPMAYTA